MQKSVSTGRYIKKGAVEFVDPGDEGYLLGNLNKLPNTTAEYFMDFEESELVFVDCVGIM